MSRDGFIEKELGKFIEENPYADTFEIAKHFLGLTYEPETKAGKYEVTLFVLGLPYHESRTRKEIIVASSEEEAEQKAHDWYIADGWGVYETRFLGYID